MNVFRNFHKIRMNDLSVTWQKVPFIFLVVQHFPLFSRYAKYLSILGGNYNIVFEPTAGIPLMPRSRAAPFPYNGLLHFLTYCLYFLFIK